MLNRLTRRIRNRTKRESLLTLGLIFVFLALTFHFWRYRYANAPVRDKFRIDEEYRGTVNSNDKAEFLRILRNDYIKTSKYPPDVVGRFFICGTEDSESLSLIGKLESWLSALRDGDIGLNLRVRYSTIQAKAFWPVRFWIEVAESADDDDHPLYDHPGLAVAAIDELDKAYSKYAAWYPPEGEPVEDLEAGEMTLSRTEYSFTSPDSIANSLRCSIYQRQLRIGEAVDLMNQEVRKSASYARMREIVAYALTGEPDPFITYPWDQDEVTERFVQNDPENPFTIRAHGLSLWSRGQYHAAERELRRAAGLFENDPLGRFAWASCMQVLGMDFEPEAVMREIPRDHPHFRTQEAKRLVWLASLYERLGQWPQAIASAERSVSLHAYDRDAWLILARVKRRRGDFTAASAAEAFAATIDDARAKLREASKAALYVTDKRAIRSGLGEMLGTMRIVRPDPSQMKPLAEQWIKAADACGWKAGAEIWRILRDFPKNEDAIERLQRLAETQEFQEDAFFLPRPALKPGEPATILRVQRWLYGL